MNTSVVEAFESRGYRFRLAGDQVMVRGPGPLLEPDRIAEIRERKPAILAELRLRNFCDLVRSTAAHDHGRLLARSEIAAELDQADREKLLTTTVQERQAWAELLAHRLTRPGPGWEDQP